MGLEETPGCNRGKQASEMASRVFETVN